jgi:hypothetical protein
MPLMLRAWERIEPEGVRMLGIKVGEDDDVILRLTANDPVDSPLPMDQHSTAISAWPVRGLPTTFVVDPQGRLVYRPVGGREWDDPKLPGQVRALKTREM